MHRSLTVSELVSSTLSNNNNDNEADNKNSKDKFITNLGIALIELLLSSLWLCHGILLQRKKLEQGSYEVGNGLWAVIFYISTFHVTAPWSKNLVGEWYDASNYQKIIFRIVVFLSTCILTIGLSSLISYGICGGLAHRIITTQLRYIAMTKFEMDELHFQCNVQLANAFCLLVLPHLLSQLVDIFKTSGYLIYIAFLFNIVPISWMIRFPKDSENSRFDEDYSYISRYQTLSVFSRQMREMQDFSKSLHSTSFTISNSDIPSMEDEEEITENVENPPTECNKSSSFTSQVDIDNDEEHSSKLKQLTHETVQFYYSNMGVNILPEIPEEPESETNSRRNTIDTNRLSKFSTTTEELYRKPASEIVIVREVVINTDHSVELPTRAATDEILVTKNLSNYENEVNKDIMEPLVVGDRLPVVDSNDEIKSIEYIHNIRSQRTRNVLKIFQYSVCTCRCSTYDKYMWKQRYRRIKDFLTDHFFLPLRYSLKDIHFYPTLASKLTISLNSVIFITLAPHLFLEKDDKYKDLDMPFLLSYMALSWCLFLVFLPLVITFSKLPMRFTFSVGLLLVAFSMSLLSKEKETNDLKIWSSVLFGFGFGMVNFSESLVYASFLNKSKSNASEGTLNVMSGCTVILIYYFINDVCELDIEIFPKISLYCYLILANFWMSVSLIELFIVYKKKNKK